MAFSDELKNGYDNPEPEREWITTAGDYPASLDGIQIGSRNAKSYLNFIWKVTYNDGSAECVGQRYWISSDTPEKTRSMGGRLRRGLDEMQLTLGEVERYLDDHTVPIPDVRAVITVKDEGQQNSYFTVVAIRDVQRKKSNAPLRQHVAQPPQQQQSQSPKQSEPQYHPAPAYPLADSYEHEERAAIQGESRYPRR